jgi:hypothetical protein
VIQFDNCVDHLVKPNDVGKIGDILSEVIFDDFQKHLFAADRDFGINKIPEEFTVVLDQQVRVCNCLLDVEESVDGFFVKFGMEVWERFYQFRDDMRIVF